MDEQIQVNMETLSPNTRRSFSFSSLRIKKRHSSEDSGMTRRRGVWAFSSARESSRKEFVRDEDGGSQLTSAEEQLKKTVMKDGRRTVH